MNEHVMMGFILSGALGIVFPRLGFAYLIMYALIEYSLHGVAR